MEFLTSRLLVGFPHGFTTRRGGHSVGPFESLNLGGAVGDEPGNVEANWADVRRATGLSFARVRQVHGCGVHHAPGPSKAPAEEADVVVSARAGVAACVSVADCVPILVADPRSGAVAAIHAGWRGTLARAAEQAVRALADTHGACPADLVAAVGPSIGPCCYEVGGEVAAQFAGDFVRAGCGGGYRLDLRAVNVAQLEAAGVPRAAISVHPSCTKCGGDGYASYRRDGAKAGRMIALVARL